MLSLGRVTVTVTSRRTGRHVTLRFRACDKERSWQTVPFDEATHVFIDDYDDERIATFYPKGGVLFFDETANEAARWTVQAVLRYLAGCNPKFLDLAEIVAEDACGKCGLPLTDPESIERGFGPDCYGMLTKSRHADLFARAA
jgi:hypothetical protein